MVTVSNLLLFATGYIVWSLTEYCLHRWGGHHRACKGRVFHNAHTKHHRDPDFFESTAMKLTLGLLLSSLVALPLSFAVGAVGAAALVIGFSAGQCTYEIIHRRIHTHAPIGWMGRALRRHHLYHHFGNPDLNHGVITRFWDRVFGTFEPVQQVKVPRKMALRWMVDERGSLAPRFADEYTLR